MSGKGRKCYWLILLVIVIAALPKANAEQNNGLRIGLIELDFSQEYMREYLGLYNATREFWQMWAKRNQIQIEFVALEIGSEQQALINGEVDLVAVAMAEDDTGEFLYSSPYIRIEPVLFVHRSQAKYKTVPSLLDISMVSAASRLNMPSELIAAPSELISELLRTGATPDAIFSLTENEVNFTLSELMLEEQYQRYSHFLPPIQFRAMALPSQRQRMLRFNQELRGWLKSEVDLLNLRHYLKPQMRLDVADLMPNLSPSEQEFVLDNPVLKVALDSNLEHPPFITRDRWRVTGISIDILHQLQQSLGVEFVAEHVGTFPQSLEAVAAGQADVVPNLSFTKRRAQQLLYTQAYDVAKTQVMVNRHLDTASYQRLSDLHKLRFAVVEGYADSAFLARTFPTATFVTFSSPDDALSSVNQGLADLFIAPQATIMAVIARNNFEQIAQLDIEVPRELARLSDSYMAVTPLRPLLHQLLEKAFDRFDQDFIAQIKAVWEQDLRLQYAERQGESLLDQLQQENQLLVNLGLLGYLALGVGIAIGISRHQRLKQTLLLAQRAKQQAAYAEMAQKHFVARMSHEVRTPMNGVLGMAESLSFTRLDSEQQQLLTALNREASHLMAFLNDVLDYSFLESRQLEISESPVRLDALFLSCVDIHQTKAIAKGLHFEHHLDSELAGVVYRSDKARLIQVFNSLLSNAVKFTEQGCVEVSLALQSSGADHDVIYFEVNDSGIGICQEQQALIFAPFGQSQQSSTRAYDGGGLGLAICQMIIDKLGGTMKFESLQGQGSMFMLTLPLTYFQCANPDQKLTDFSDVSTLLVEDNVMNQRVLKQQLERYGVKLDLAITGREALDYIESNGLDHYQLILSDCHMPEMDGFTLAKDVARLRSENDSNILLVAVTADTFAITAGHCHQAGFDEAFAKPCNEEMLGGILQRAQLRARNAVGDSRLSPSFITEKLPLLEIVEEPIRCEVEEGELTCTTLATKPTEMINRAEVLNLSGHDHAVLTEVLEIFVSSVAKDIVAIEQSYQQQQWRKVKDFSHRIKGSVRYLGASEIADIAEQVEKAAKRENQQLLATQLPLLVEGGLQLRQEVEQWLEQLHHH